MQILLVRLRHQCNSDSTILGLVSSVNYGQLSACLLLSALIGALILNIYSATLLPLYETYTLMSYCFLHQLPQLNRICNFWNILASTFFTLMFVLRVHFDALENAISQCFLSVCTLSSCCKCKNRYLP